MINSNKSTFKKAHGFLNSLKRFAKVERGNVSIMAGLSIIPLLITGGAAIDYERGVNAGTILQASLDSAALYAVALPDVTNAALTAKSQIYMQQNYKYNGDATLSSFAITNNGPSVTATAKATLKNNFMSIVGFPTTVLSGTATVLKSGINLEVSMVLDNTNSMNKVNPQTGNTAIADLKTAAAKFVNMVMPTTQGLFYTKIAAIPYGNAVNLKTNHLDPADLAKQARGLYLAGTGSAVQGFDHNQFTPFTGGQKVSLPVSPTCVTERQGVNSYNDSAIGVVVGATPVGFQYGPSGNDCLVTPLQPLTTTATALTGVINSMSAGGSTAGQVGIAWGWYSLSPNVGIWPIANAAAPYTVVTNSPLYNPATPYNLRTRKIMILMTDGEYNSAYCQGVISGPSSLIGSGSQGDQIGCASPLGDSYAQANAMCTAIKQTGIELFVITFQLDKNFPQRVALTQNCAMDAAHVIDADTTSLDAAFAKIANSIVAMRITN